MVLTGRERSMGKVLAMLLAIILVIGLAISGLEAAFADTEAPCEPYYFGGAIGQPGYTYDEGEVTLIFTHDIHSHLDPFKVADSEGSIKSVGGLARIKTEADRLRSLNEASWLVDAGDFSMGTLYQTLYETHAAELVILAKIGCEATIFGNHEFDYHSKGVQNMFTAAEETAAAEELTLPQFLSSSIDWEINNSEDNMLLKQALDELGAKEYTIIEHAGIRIGFFGLVGADSEACAPEAGVDFSDIIPTSKRIVAALQAEGADMIVALSHSGTYDNPDGSEDELLAKAVPDIDVIVSAHSHTYLPEPIIVGKTVIASAECYGRYLGELALVPDGNGRWDLKHYEMLEVTEGIPEDEAIVEACAQYRNIIDEQYLAPFGYTYNQVVAVNDIPFTQMSDVYEGLREEPLGSIIADSYIYAVHEAEGTDYIPVAATVEPTGVIRDTIQKGEVTIWDVYNISCLGTGADGIPGYPLVDCYLTGAELRTLAEVDASVSSLMKEAQLFPSGISWTYNPNRLILNRIESVSLADTSKGVPTPDAYLPENLVPLKDDQLYRVAGGLYSLQMLGAVQAKSYGLLSIVPKDENGEPVTDFASRAIHDKDGKEIKEWYALATYLDSFEENADGISVIPSRYAAAEGRKVCDDSHSLTAILGAPNSIAQALYAIVGIIIIMVIAIVVIIKKLRRLKRKNSKPAQTE